MNYFYSMRDIMNCLYQVKIFILGAVVVLLTACGGGEDVAKKPAKQVISASKVSSKIYTVGTDPTYAPFEYRDEDGQPIGFDIDLINAIAKEQGFQVKFQTFLWNGMLQKVDNEVDILVSGIAITDERKKMVNFSDPYLETYGVVAVRNNSKLNSLAEVGKARVAMHSGEYNVQFVEPLMQAEGQLQKQQTLFLAFRQFATDQADAVAGNVHVVRFYTKQYGIGTREILLTDQKNNLGFVVGKRNPELLLQINKGLRKLKANGEYQKLVNKWFMVASS